MKIYSTVIKRILDLIISIMAFPFVLLFIIIFAPIIWLTDRGPVFYCAERLGKKGSTFKMIKFRSMKVNSPNLRNADGSTYNSADDPRVTKIGKLMRKTSIDEIPQFLNVLVGQMSIVGPRAFMTTSYQGYEKLDEKRKKRLEVKPGITGYAQAYYRNSITTEEKIKWDCYYADNVSFLLDLKILFMTAKTVLLRRNIYTNN